MASLYNKTGPHHLFMGSAFLGGGGSRSHGALFKVSKNIQKANLILISHDSGFRSVDCNPEFERAEI